jgi:hypothetical protein
VKNIVTQFVLCCLLLFTTSVFAQFNLDSILQSSPLLKKVYANKSKYHLQVCYTRVMKQENASMYKYYSFNTDAYAYCASLIKLPIAVLALNKLNELGISEEAYLFTDSSEACHHKVSRDTSAQSGYPSIAHYIRKMLLVSDNESFNRCFEFLGADYIHLQLAKWGFPEVRIVNRYELPCAKGKNLVTNPVRLLDQNLKVLYEQGPQPIQEKWQKPMQRVLIGKAYLDQNNRYIKGPKDFSYMNFMRLEDVHRFLVELLYSRPDKFNLSRNQSDLLRRYMSMAPAEAGFPRYDAKTYPTNYKKYLYYGDKVESVNDSTFVSTNIVGLSYGFISDCTGFKDQTTGIEFVLSASLYVNENEIINDGKYEYKQLGLPFLAELGRKIIEYEKKAKGINRKE